MSEDTSTFYSQNPYPFGFSTDIDTESLPKGLCEETIYLIWKKKNEPDFMLDFRMKAYKKFLEMDPPNWADLNIAPFDLQDITYYSAPKNKQSIESLDQLDPEIKKTLDRLGIPLDEQERLSNVAIDVVFDSVSLGTTFRKTLEEAGVVLCSISEAIHKYPELIKKYLGSVVPISDNYYSALNSAVFSDGSFVYIPKGVRCPIELSTYFRINDKESGQFERTLIICEDDAYVSYLEGCTAPSYDKNQLHAAVVELIAKDRAEIRYSTVQNWYAGDKQTGLGGIYNFVTKRGRAQGVKSKISWTQVEAGAAITWKYPSCILQGDESQGEFYSVALTNGFMQADTGTKMIHLGKNTTSTIISKGISADFSRNSYRGLVKIAPSAQGARNYTQCDSMLVGTKCAANTYPVIEVANSSAILEHEASTSKMSEDQLFYLSSRGLSKEEAISLLVSGFCEDVIKVLPLEFAQEAQKLLTIKLENSVG
jgi:Fe-S cluster assembly protein SufB